MLEKRTAEVGGQLRIVAAGPLVVPLEELAESDGWSEETMRQVIGAYRDSLADHHHPIEKFEYAHAARKVVGVGSVGTDALIALLVGRDNRDVLFLQAKEAKPSLLQPYVGASEHANHGRRVVVGQRLMQAASDIFLGWIRLERADGPRDYYVRQLHDWKGGAEVESFRPAGAALYGRLCGVTLAPRARALGRQDRDRLVPGSVGQVRQGDRELRRRLCRPERARLRVARRGRPFGTRRGRDRRLSDQRA